ncbi:hypothetical protein D770_05105 [Flammeovirgaceae bacterium 311]|nr:hypothetical protein D770_05105 [Flammeovirgaceae bacterium 311]
MNPKCVFCLTTDTSLFNTKEHIIPESLGGGDWAILPDGLLCDSCQNKFGSSIEQQALATYPLSMFRTFFSIPTKKRKAPWFEFWEGKLEAGGIFGLLAYHPHKHLEDATLLGKKHQMRIPAVVTKPDMLLRTLLKIGLELIAADDPIKVFETRFDVTRKYALTGQKNFSWSFIQIEDVDELNQYLKGMTQNDFDKNFYADINEFENG